MVDLHQIYVFPSLPPSLLDPFLSVIPLEGNTQSGLWEDSNRKVNRARGRNRNRFSMQISCCLPENFWIFCSLMFISVQNSLGKIGTMQVKRGHFPLVLVSHNVWTCTSALPSHSKRWQPLCLLPWSLSFSCEGSADVHALSLGPKQSPRPARKLQHMGWWSWTMLWRQRLLMKDWDKYIETEVVLKHGG